MLVGLNAKMSLFCQGKTPIQFMNKDQEKDREQNEKIKKVFICLLGVVWLGHVQQYSEAIPGYVQE